MSTHTAMLEVATIGQQCKVLHLPTVAARLSAGRRRSVIVITP